MKSLSVRLGRGGRDVVDFVELLRSNHSNKQDIALLKEI